MPESPPDRVVTADTAGVSKDTAVADSRVTAGAAALAQAQALARPATAPATLRAYKADWAHWPGARRPASCRCPPRPRRSARISPAWPRPTRRRRSAGACRRSARCAASTTCRGIPRTATSRNHCGLLRQHGRPPQKAAPLTLAMLRRLLATCDPSARGRRDRALLLFGFAGAVRRSELVALRVD